MSKHNKSRIIKPCVKFKILIRFLSAIVVVDDFFPLLLLWIGCLLKPRSPFDHNPILDSGHFFLTKTFFESSEQMLHLINTLFMCSQPYSRGIRVKTHKIPFFCFPLKKTVVAVVDFFSPRISSVHIPQKLSREKKKRIFVNIYLMYSHSFGPKKKHAHSISQHR